MEIQLEALEGFLVPSDCYYAFRVGSEKRQGRLAPQQKFQFPECAGRQPCRLEIFQRIGSWSTSLDPAGCNVQESRMRCPEAGLDVRFRAAASALPTEQKTPLQSPVKVKINKAPPSGQSNLVEVLAESMQVVLREKPQDPYSFLASRVHDYLQQQPKQSPTVRQAVEHLHVEREPEDNNRDNAEPEPEHHKEQEEECQQLKVAKQQQQQQEQQQSSRRSSKQLQHQVEGLPRQRHSSSTPALPSAADAAAGSSVAAQQKQVKSAMKPRGSSQRTSERRSVTVVGQPWDPSASMEISETRASSKEVPSYIKDAEEQGLAFIQQLTMDETYSKERWRQHDVHQRALKDQQVSSSDSHSMRHSKSGPLPLINRKAAPEDEGRAAAEEPVKKLYASPSNKVEIALKVAANWICDAEAILVGSGAGMGVDCGLGTYRGRNAGVWKPLERMGLDYSEICTPGSLSDDPQLAWAFWRHCHVAYKSCTPHDGYRIISSWGQRAPLGAFCYTTNVDGLWTRIVPEDQVYEVHGSCMHLQCTWNGDTCQRRGTVWPCPADMSASVCLEPGCDDRVAWDHIPRCSGCGSVARPNVLMFGDFEYCRRRSREQGKCYKRWLRKVESHMSHISHSASQQTPLFVCLEVGAGRAVPTVRTTLEQRATEHPHGRLIRINTDDYELPEALEGGQAVAIPLGALEALRRIDCHMRKNS